MELLMGAFGLLIPIFIGLGVLVNGLQGGQDKSKTQAQRIEQGNNAMGGCLMVVLAGGFMLLILFVVVITTFAV